MTYRWRKLWVMTIVIQYSSDRQTTQTTIALYLCFPYCLKYLRGTFTTPHPPWTCPTQPVRLRSKSVMCHISIWAARWLAEHKKGRKNYDSIYRFQEILRFGPTWHANQENKSWRIGITGWFLTLLKSFLTGRQVKVGSSTSPLWTVSFGVPHGSILSPTLFSIFINDLLSSTTFLQSHAYADDTIFYESNSSTSELCKNTQNDTNVINQWCTNNNMFTSHNKSHFMLLRLRKP